jgi:hypothetical protein
LAPARLPERQPQPAEKICARACGRAATIDKAAITRDSPHTELAASANPPQFRRPSDKNAESLTIAEMQTGGR